MSANARPPSRRQMMTRGAFGLSAAVVPVTGHATPSESAGAGAILAVKAIHQELHFDASPHRIYEALLNSREFTFFSGGRRADIQREAGGRFSVFAGHIIGRNLELIPERRIVQAWRVVSWPEGIYSVARFELQNQDSGTRLIFDHTGFPTELAEHLESGWRQNYWEPLRKHLVS